MFHGVANYEFFDKFIDEMNAIVKNEYEMYSKMVNDIILKECDCGCLVGMIY